MTKMDPRKDSNKRKKKKKNETNQANYKKTIKNINEKR